MKHILTILLSLIVVTLAQAQLPQVELKDLQNNVVNTSELSNEGKPFIISFFATWCKPCLRSLMSSSSMARGALHSLIVATPRVVSRSSSLRYVSY